MGLHVGCFGAKDLLDAVDGQLLGDVDKFAATVVALAWVAFGVFVGEHRALGLQNRLRNDVLRGDQLDLVALAAQRAPGLLQPRLQAALAASDVPVTITLPGGSTPFNVKGLSLSKPPPNMGKRIRPPLGACGCT